MRQMFRILLAGSMLAGATAAIAQAGSGPADGSDQGTATASSDTTVNAGTANAQTTESAAAGDIVVTAERRTSTVQTTAAAVSVRSGEDLRERGRNTLQQILEDVPGVSFRAGSSEAPGLGVVIRGVVPQQAPVGPSAVPTTAIYVDGVYSGVGGDYDVSRVEVLKGPQGTLYGRSATGGVVSTTTADPTLGRVTGYALGELGNYRLAHEEGAVNLPLGDMFAARLSGSRYVRDGFISADGGYDRREQARAKVLFQPSDNFWVVAGAALDNEHPNSGGTQLFLSSPNTYTSTSQAVVGSVNHYRQYWATVNLNLGPATLTYIPAYRTYTTAGQQIVGGVLNQFQNTPKDHFLTQEVRLTSNSSSRFKWLVGGFYYDNKIKYNNLNSWIASGAEEFEQSNDKRTDDGGIFGEATYSFTDTTRVTGGLRYDRTTVQSNETYTANGSTNTAGGPMSPTFKSPAVLSTAVINGSLGHRAFDNVTFKARIEQDVAPNHLVYASVSSGFLPGDVQASTAGGGGMGKTTSVVVLPYDEERLTAFEVGTKNQFLDRRLTLNGSLFYYRYTGYQQSTDTDPTGSVNYVLLTSPARMKGGEIEGAFRPTPLDQFSFSYAHIAAYFVNRPTLFSTYIAQKDITNIAPDTATLAYDHTFDLDTSGSLLAHGDVRYAGGHDLGTLTPAAVALGAEPYVHVGNVTLFDASLTYKGPNGLFTLTGYVRNIGDKTVKNAPNVSLNSALTAISTVSVSTNEPRTFGAVLQVNF